MFQRKKYFSIIYFTLVCSARLRHTLSFDVQNLSTYEYMDKYNAETSFEQVHDYCKGFVCQVSGLTEISIVHLLQKENQIRNTFAGVRELSNMYSVKWNADFARLARSKALLCLPKTTNDQTIFDTKMLQKLPYFEQLNDSLSAKALEVVIGTSTKEIGTQQITNVYTDMAIEITDMLGDEHFNHQDALLRRGNTLFMGCDYLVRNNATHVFGNIVCIYGLLYFSNQYYNDFIPLKGNPCSDCASFYDRHPALTSSTNLSRKWACDLQYPYLCRDTFDSTVYQEHAHMYPCDSSPQTTTPSPVTYMIITIPPSEYDYTTLPPHKWPCYQYTVPVVLLTVIVLVLIIYHIITIIIIIIRRRRNKNVI